jgi:hypothetical protein
MLASWKIATESEEDITRCLLQAKDRYGPPQFVLSDLSKRIANACEKALPNVPVGVCHSHLCSDIGDDLYRQPQSDLMKRLRKIKLQVHLRDQRHSQVHAVREKLKDPKNALVLQDLLAGKDVCIASEQLLGKEILLAFHCWLMDYAHDGHRLGYPFDPYLLYFHRRIVIGHAAISRLLHYDWVQRLGPQTLVNLSKHLEAYLADPEIQAAASLYEKANAIFESLRDALRLKPENSSPMRDTFFLQDHQTQELAKNLSDLRHDLRNQATHHSDPHIRHMSLIVVQHLDKYWDRIVLDLPNRRPRERTTRKIENWWARSKHAKRKVAGRGNLSPQFKALPPEYMLTFNLENPAFVNLMLGSLDNLPSQLALASRSAGPLSHWKRRIKPVACGRIPSRLLRQNNFVHKLLDAIDSRFIP